MIETAVYVALECGKLYSNLGSGNWGKHFMRNNFRPNFSKIIDACDEFVEKGGVPNFYETIHNSPEIK